MRCLQHLINKTHKLFSAITCNHCHVITGQESSLTVGFKHIIIISDCQENHPVWTEDMEKYPTDTEKHISWRERDRNKFHHTKNLLQEWVSTLFFLTFVQRLRYYFPAPTSESTSTATPSAKHMAHPDSSDPLLLPITACPSLLCATKAISAVPAFHEIHFGLKTKRILTLVKCCWEESVFSQNYF